MDQADRRRRHPELEHAAADDYGGAFSCHLPLHSGFKVHLSYQYFFKKNYNYLIDM